MSNTTSKRAESCWAFQTGTCRYGDECKYAHVPDATFRRRGCVFQAKGRCRKEAACTFSHDAEVLAALEADGSGNGGEKAKKSRGVCTFWLKGKCKMGRACFFAHGSVDEDGKVETGKKEGVVDNAEGEGGKSDGGDGEPIDGADENYGKTKDESVVVEAKGENKG